MVADRHHPQNPPSVRGLNPQLAMEPPGDLVQLAVGLRVAQKMPEAQVGQLEPLRPALLDYPGRVRLRGPVLAVSAPRR
jgi:hypothetical protein